MFRTLLLAICLVLLAWPVAANTADATDRSYLWRSEGGCSHVLPEGILADWPRDAVYGYDVDHVHLEMTFDMVASSIDAASSLSVTISEPDLLELPVDLGNALTVTAASVDGFPVAFAQTTEQVLLTLLSPLDVGTAHTLRVEYNGMPPQIGNKGLRFGSHSGVRNVYAISTPYSNAGETVIPISHSWRACKDVADDKSTFSCDLTIPEDMLACSNGLMTANVDNLDGTRTVSWAHDYPVAPYLITVGVTNFQTLEEVYNGPEGSALVQHFVFPERVTQAQTSFDITVPAMAFFATVFGEYPFIGEKYGMFSTPQTASNPAVEEQTMTAYPENLINGIHIYDWLLVHELAHQWWGDCLTVADWAHVWLSEGLSSYSEALWKEHVQGPAAYRSWMNAMNSGPFAGALYDPPYVWHSIVYDKGAWILHMLRGIMGDADFFQFLLDYRNAHEWGSVVTDDLVAAAEANYGESMDWFFEPWIYHEGRPTYEYFWSVNDGPPYMLRINLQQTQSQDFPTYTMPIQVEVTTGSGVEEHVIWSTQRSETFDLAVADEPTMVRFDRWDWILADFSELPTAAPDEQAPVGTFVLAQNSPNPFNPATTIRFQVTQPGRVALRIFDERGRMLRTLLNESVPAGERTVNWDGRDDQGRALASGVYLYQLVAPDGVLQRKMMLLQ